METLLLLLQYILPALGTLLAVLGSWVVKKVVDKAGLARSEQIDSMIDRYVGVGVKYAEAVATKKLMTRELSGNDKMSLAVKTVMDELDQSGIKKVGEDLIMARIESYLFDKEDEPGKTG